MWSYLYFRTCISPYFSNIHNLDILKLNLTIPIDLIVYMLLKYSLLLLATPSYFVGNVYLPLVRKVWGIQWSTSQLGTLENCVLQEQVVMVAVLSDHNSSLLIWHYRPNALKTYLVSLNRAGPLLCSGVSKPLPTLKWIYLSLLRT